MTSEQDHSEVSKRDNKNHASNGVDQGPKSAFGLFDDPDIQENIKDDPVFQFMKRHQSTLLTLAVVGIFGYFLYQWYEKNQLELMQSQATLLSELKDSVETWEEGKQALGELPEDASEEDKTKSQEELEAVARKVMGKLEALQNGSFPYNQIALGYKARFLAEAGRVSELEGLLTEIESARVEKDAHYADLARLLIAKAMFNEKELEERGWKLLTELTKVNSFVATSAAISLSRLANSDIRKQDAKLAIEELKARQPEQGAALDAAAARLSSNN